MNSTSDLMTAEELLWLHDDNNRHELVRGRLITLPFHGYMHGSVTTNLAVMLSEAVKPNKLGTLLIASGFKLESNPDTVLAPDIAFIRRERVGVKPKGYFEGAPDLAVEVLDPPSFGLVEDSSRWIPFGTAMVWVVDPETETVEVSLANGERKLLTENDELTGGELIPGFRVRVSEIFAD